MGSWSLTGEEKDIATLKEAVMDSVLGENAVFCCGSPMIGSEVSLEGFQECTREDFSREEQERMLEDAVETAKKAELVVMALGFPYCVGQVPVHYNEYATGRPMFRERIRTDSVQNIWIFPIRPFIHSDMD